MALSRYGVVKGTIVGHLRDASDDHYQILTQAGDTIFRIAINVKSAAPHAPSTLLYEAVEQLPVGFTDSLQALSVGCTAVASQPNTLAVDFLRSGFVDVPHMQVVPTDQSGGLNNLKDTLETIVTDAMSEVGSLVYAFGSRWGPEDKDDQYFHFVPGNGIHDIHMNQGNGGNYVKDNGTYQDGCLIIGRPNNRWHAVFLAFQSQSIPTDDHGNSVQSGGNPPGHGRKHHKHH